MRTVGAVAALVGAALVGAGGAFAGGNLLPNGGFEGTASGWGGWNAAVTLAPGGAEGASSGRVARTSGSAYATYVSPRPVSTMAGARYAAGGWVRADAPGRTVCLRLREWAGATLAGSAQRCVTVTSAWQRFPEVVYVAVGTGRALDLDVYQAAAGKGDSFALDGMSLVDATAPADTAPPETTIESGPSGSTTETSATFAFSADEPGSTFACSLDGAPFAACSSPHALTGLAPGAHVFRVRAADAAGNADPTPAERSWTVEEPPPPPAGAPETSIASGPSGTVRTNSPVFAFASDRSGATFECSLDGAAFSPCAAGPVHVGAGGHVLAVRAVAAGVPDPTPATRSWWSDGLLQNGNFELSDRGWKRQNYAVAGWKSYNAALTAVAGGVAGPGAGRVAFASGTSYSIYSSPKPVNATVAGRGYRATGWARSDAPGRTLCLRIREFAGATVVGGAQSCLVAGASWQAFAPVGYTASVAGSELEVYVYQSTPPASGDSFEVDGIALEDGAGDPAPAAAPADPVLLATADVGSCWSSGDEAVARLLDGLAGTIALAGDTEQNYGSPDEFAGCYDLAWGRHLARTKPAVGDHEYREPGAAGYFGYFGAAAGEPGRGWYSYDLGAWHVVVLNSNCDEVGGCGPGSPQHEWLRADLAASARDCTAAYFHHPRWSAGSLHGDKEHVAPFWELLHAYSAELVFGGNDHTYQRWAPQAPDGTLDPERGIRQFVVGTGGTMHYELGGPRANLEVAHTGTFGVLELTLRDGSYAWRFVPQEGKTFADSGSTACSPLPAPPAVALTAPADGDTVSGEVSLAATAERAVRVDFLVGGEVVASDSTAPYAVSWDSRSRADGPVTVLARAVDAAGRTAEARAAVTVRNAADTTPPDTVIDGGPEGSTGETSATFAFSSPEPGVAFECSLDASAFGPCASPHSVSGLAEGPHTFSVRAVDAAGNADPTPAERTWTVEPPPPPPPPPSENLLGNGGFDGTLDGWRGYNAGLSLVAPAEGSHAVRVTWSGGGTSFSIYPSPRPVASTAAGATYTARGLVRTDQPGQVCLRIREWSGSTLVGSAHACVAATGDWQAFPAVAHAAVAGGSSLEVYAYRLSPAAGSSFDLDALSLVAVS